MGRQIICYNGRLYRDDARPDFLDIEYFAYQHVLHYASAAFEGIRCYPNKAGDGTVNVVALEPHIDRLFASMEFAWLNPPSNAAQVWNEFSRSHPDLVDKYKSVLQSKLSDKNAKKFAWSKSEVQRQITETVLLNLHTGFCTAEQGCYIRPLAFRSVNPQKGLGVFSMGHAVDFLVLVKAWGKYLGPEAFEKGAPVLIHPEGCQEFNRHHKLASNYLTGQRLANFCAANRFNETILTDASADRNVLEGTGENLVFYLGNNQFISPRQEGQPILPGITLQIVAQILRSLGGTLTYRPIPLAEIFGGKILGAAMTGTACEVTPISLVYDPKEKRAVEIPVAVEIKQLQKAYLDLVQGEPSALITPIAWNAPEHDALLQKIQ